MLLSTNGQNIYPEEIEVLLNSLPGVQESVVVQREHLLHAIIVPKEEEETATEATTEDTATESSEEEA